MEIEGVKLEIEYDYYPAIRGYRDSMGVPEEPDEPEWIDITEVRSEEDVMPLLADWVLDKIVMKIMEERDE